MFLCKLKIALLVLPLLALTAFAALGLHSATGQAPPVGESIRGPQPAPATKAADPAKQPVAVIFDNIPVTREELGEFLIARYGAQAIETLVNRRIIDHFCARAGVEVTEQEIEAVLNEDLAGLRMSRAAFRDHLLKQLGKSLYQWREDVIRPKVQLGKLCRAKITVSDDELRQMFEHLYGPKVRCKMILWPKGEDSAARKAYDEIRRSDEAFDRAARLQPNAQLAATGGEVPPFARHSGDRALEEEVFKLKPGEVSPLRVLEDGQFLLVKCLGHVPPAQGKDFAAERPRLMQHVIDRKIAREIPKLFQTYRDAARPRILLQPPAADAADKHLRSRGEPHLPE